MSKYKLGFGDKGSFLSSHFIKTLEKYFEGGNCKETVPIDDQIVGVLKGLSRAYDEAEEYESSYK